MKVKQLIDQLQQMDQDLVLAVQVHYGDGESSTVDVYNVDVKNATVSIFFDQNEVDEDEEDEESYDG